jgi:hypothetical protein
LVCRRVGGFCEGAFERRLPVLASLKQATPEH